MDPDSVSKLSEMLEVTLDAPVENPDTCKTGPDKAGFSINLDRIQEVLLDEQVCVIFKNPLQFKYKHIMRHNIYLVKKLNLN